MDMKYFLFSIVILLITIGMARADFGINNPTLPNIQEPSGAGGVIISGNGTNFTNYWTTNTDQSGLTNTKSGSYNLSTNGTINYGSSYLANALIGVGISNFYSNTGAIASSVILNNHGGTNNYAERVLNGAVDLYFADLNGGNYAINVVSGDSLFQDIYAENINANKNVYAIENVTANYFCFSDGNCFNNSNYWTTNTDQSGLTNTKSGSYNLTSTDTLKFSKGKFTNGIYSNAYNIKLIDSENGGLMSTGGINTLQWYTIQRLNNVDGSEALDWNNRALLDSSSKLSQNWQLRKLYNSTENEVINYETKTLEGNWTEDNVALCLADGTNCRNSTFNTTNIAYVNETNNFIQNNNFMNISVNGTINETSTDIMRFLSDERTFYSKPASDNFIKILPSLKWSSLGAVAGVTTVLGNAFGYNDYRNLTGTTSSNNNDLIKGTTFSTGLYNNYNFSATFGNPTVKAYVVYNTFLDQSNYSNGKYKTTIYNNYFASSLSPIVSGASNEYNGYGFYNYVYGVPIQENASSKFNYNAYGYYMDLNSPTNAISNSSGYGYYCKLSGSTFNKSYCYYEESSTPNYFAGNFTIDNNLTVTKNTILNNLNVTGNLSAKRPYFNGYDNSTQNFLNTANVQVINISNNNDYDNYLINVTGNQNLTFQQTGDYICTLSPEFFQNSGGTSLVTFWIQKNGTDVAWSNSRYTVQNNAYTAPSITYQFDIHNPSTENIRFMWWSDSTSTQLYSSGVLTSPTRPSIPSILINCQKISEVVT